MNETNSNDLLGSESFDMVCPECTSEKVVFNIRHNRDGKWEHYCAECGFDFMTPEKQEPNAELRCERKAKP